MREVFVQVQGVRLRECLEVLNEALCTSRFTNKKMRCHVRSTEDWKEDVNPKGPSIDEESFHLQRQALKSNFITIVSVKHSLCVSRRFFARFLSAATTPIICARGYCYMVSKCSSYFQYHELKIYILSSCWDMAWVVVTLYISPIFVQQQHPLIDF